MIPYEFLHKLPKIELHCHLDGSLRLSTALELGREKGLTDAKTEEELSNYFGLGKRHESLVDYLKAFDYTCALMQDEASLRRICRELVEDAAAENIVHLEVRYAPILHTKEGLSRAEVHRAVADELQSAGKEFNVSVSVVVCGMRHMPDHETLAEAAVAADFADRIPTAFDLAGPEAGFPPSRHKRALEFARAHGLFLTIHAGEAAGPESVWDALLNGAQRIGHGVQAAKDSKLLQTLANWQIGVEVCLTSNLQTGAVSTLSDHPLKEFLSRNIPTTLCTDNRLVSKTTLTNEYELAVREFGIGMEEIAQLIFGGLKSAFLPPDQKRHLWERIYNDFASLCEEYSLPIPQPLGV